MAVSLTVLASGSRGNCSLICSARARILVDAGLSCRETLRRLQAAHESHDITAIVVTHEHSDHVGGLTTLARKLKTTVYMTGATHQAWQRNERHKANGNSHLDRLELITAGRAFSIGDICIQPFTVPHDASDPVMFTFRAEGIKIGVVTDLGYLPASVCDAIGGCDGLVIESNHDLEMLRIGPYPWPVKQRVMSRVGHLSNEALADFLVKDYDGDAAFVVLAHLSEQNNHPDIARRAAESALGGRRSLLHNHLMLASQDQPLATIRL